MFTTISAITLVVANHFFFHIGMQFFIAETLRSCSSSGICLSPAAGEEEFFRRPRHLREIAQGLRYVFLQWKKLLQAFCQE
jgi:hypothetical protein